MKFKEIIVKTINVANRTYVDSNGVSQPLQPLEIYLVPIPSTTEHERFVADNNGFVSKQSSGSAGGDFIPLSGTESDKNITGNIRFDNGVGNLWIDNDKMCKVDALNGIYRASVLDFNTNNQTNLLIYPNYVEIQGNQSNCEGIKGAIDFSANYTDFSFVQKKYVDNKINSERKYLTNDGGLGGIVGDAFVETIGNKAFVHLNISSITIAAGDSIVIETADNQAYLPTEKIHWLNDGRTLTISTMGNNPGIRLKNNSDSGTFKIHDTLVFYVSDEVPV